VQYCVGEVEDACFFCCQPEKDRVLYESEHFYVLLGLGPIVEGYVLLVAKKHFRSMFDLPEAIRDSYIQEKARLKQLINNTYGPAIVTEHGRVQACAVEDEEAHDLLCYHAHQLFFPVQADLSNFAREGRFEKIFEGASLFDMPSSLLQEQDEYLLFEESNGQVHIHKVIGKCPRQFMRYLVAERAGKPELASWQRHPGRDLIAKALVKYQEKLGVASTESQRLQPVGD
jgi:hypothetical protein